MSDYPRQVTQDAWTTVQFLPSGASLEQIDALLTDAVLRSRSLERDQPDKVRAGALPGERYTYASLRALDLGRGWRWRGSAEWRLEHDEENHVAALRINVSGYAGHHTEEEAANAARVAWRLGDALAQAYGQAGTGRRA